MTGAKESVLARWARRKQAAATNARDEPNLEHSGDGASADAAPLPAGDGQALIDPEELPPIGTLGARSDIKPFLADGVPADLTRAALRRVWSADPAIRDFIGLSENSWDFNELGGVPGFGALTMEDARRLLTQVTKEAETLGAPDPGAERLTDDQTSAPAGQFQTTTDTNRTEFGPDTAQHRGEQHKPRRSVPRRPHGGALPD